MDTYYLSENELTDLLKRAYTKGYHGFLDLADSAVEELLKGASAAKYSPKEILSGSTTIAGSVVPLFDSIVPQDTDATVNIGTDILPDNIVLEQETINLNTGDG